MPFNEDDAVEIAAASEEVKKFEEKHLENGWNIEKISSKATQNWIKNNPAVMVRLQGKLLPKNLWLVEIEAFEDEKLIIIINPSTKKIISAKIEKLEPEFEENTWEGDEGDEIETEITFDEDNAIVIASNSVEVKKFEDKHPNCSWNVEPLKNFWKVELEEFENEKLTLYIDLHSKKILECKIEKLENELEEEEEEEIEEEEEDIFEEESQFSEDDAVEIAATAKDVEAFENIHPECVWNIEKMDPKNTERWIKEHPKIEDLAKGEGRSENLWIVELEALKDEKLILIINPSVKKIIERKIEKLELETEEEEEDEDDDEYKEENNEEIDEAQLFNEDSAFKIASVTDEAKKFEKKYPGSVWNVEQMNSKATEKWIKENPNTDVIPQGNEPLKNLWVIELEALEKEKLILVINPLTEKIVGIKTEELKPLPNE